MAKNPRSSPPQVQDLATLLNGMDTIAANLAKEQALLNKSGVNAKVSRLVIKKRRDPFTRRAGHFLAVLPFAWPAFIGQLELASRGARHGIEVLEGDLDRNELAPEASKRIKSAHADLFAGFQTVPAVRHPSGNLTTDLCNRLLRSARQAAQRECTLDGKKVVWKLRQFQLPLRRYLHILRLSDAACKVRLSQRISNRERAAVGLRTLTPLADPEPLIQDLRQLLNDPDKILIDLCWRLGRIKARGGNWHAASDCFEKAYGLADRRAEPHWSAYLAMEWAYSLTRFQNSDSGEPLKLYRRHHRNYPPPGYAYPLLSAADLFHLGK